MRADYGGPCKARPRERVENEVRDLEAQLFWRAEREQNFLLIEARVGDRKIVVEFRQ